MGIGQLRKQAESTGELVGQWVPQEGLGGQVESLGYGGGQIGSAGRG